MHRQITCECGYIARADSDDEVTAKIREHLRLDHPELVDVVTDADIRGWIAILG